MASKTLINRTGRPLHVTLIVRQGDHPEHSAGTVEVTLGTANGENERAVSYGSERNVYLNGIATVLDGGGGSRNVVIERGSTFDQQINANDTIEFLFDGAHVLMSASKARDRHIAFPG